MARITGPQDVTLTSWEYLQAFLVLFAILNMAFFQALWGHRTLMSSAHSAASVTATGAYGSKTLPPAKYLRTLDPGAPAWQFEPAMAFNHNELFKNHHLPLWNPFAAYGVPWAANMLSQPFYPLSFLLSLDPTPRTVSWFLILRLLAAGFFAYLFLRYFMRHAAALVGGIAFMLTGYFIIFINIDHLSTEILLPVVFYGIEGLLRDPSIKAKLLATASVFLVIVAGMPECTFIILTYGGVYFLYRLFSLAQFRSNIRGHLTDFVASNGLGIGLAAFLLLPFCEFLRNGLDSHRPSIVGLYTGLRHIPQPSKQLLFYLFPIATGPPYVHFGDFSGHVWGYFGVVATTLAVLGLVSAIRMALEGFWGDSDGPLILFFFASALAFLLKVFGSGIINWVGYMPGFDMLDFPKYLQPPLGFAVAMLAGFGASYLFAKRARLVDVLVAPVAVLAIITFCCMSFRHELSSLPQNDHLFYLNIVCGLAGLLLMTVIMACITGYDRLRNISVSRVGSCGIIFLLTAELLGNFIVPMFYHFTFMAPDTANPYAGAPYVRFLQRHSDDYFRVFARDYLLYPNWSSAFGIYDVRYLYAVNWNRFMFFIRSFLSSGNLQRSGDLVDRFTGTGTYSPYMVASWKERRFLQLSSILYLVSKEGYADRLSPQITEMLSQNERRIESERLHVYRTEFHISGETRDVLFEHPPTHRLQLSTVVEPSKPVLAFSPALDPATYVMNCGDGVDFTVEVQDDAGRIRRVYQRYIDPKHNVPERIWLDERIDLSQYRGQLITLLFSTSGGPSRNTACDWAGWAGLRFAPTHAPDLSQAKSGVRDVYRNEVTISEVANPLPRASIFYAIDLASSEDAALQKLQNPAVDIWRRVVVVPNDLAHKRVPHILQELSLANGMAVQPALIVFYDSQRVIIHAKMDHPGLVMLTDSNYPGWNAYLDGHRVPIFSANYLFRGVLAPTGTHTIEFRYEPRSYLYGGLVTLCALLLLGAWMLGSARHGSMCLALLKSRNKTKTPCVL
jgi:hypothetical protein